MKDQLTVKAHGLKRRLVVSSASLTACWSETFSASNSWALFLSAWPQTEVSLVSLLANKRRTTYESCHDTHIHPIVTMAPRVQPIHMDRETNLNNGLTERIGPQSWRAQTTAPTPTPGAFNCASSVRCSSWNWKMNENGKLENHPRPKEQDDCSLGDTG